MFMSLIDFIYFNEFYSFAKSNLASLTFLIVIFSILARNPIIYIPILSIFSIVFLIFGTYSITTLSNDDINHLLDKDYINETHLKGIGPIITPELILSNKLVVEKEERDKAFQINKKQLKIDGDKRLKEILDSRKS